MLRCCAEDLRGAGPRQLEARRRHDHRSWIGCRPLWVVLIADGAVQQRSDLAESAHPDRNRGRALGPGPDREQCDAPRVVPRHAKELIGTQRMGHEHSLWDRVRCFHHHPIVVRPEPAVNRAFSRTSRVGPARDFVDQAPAPASTTRYRPLRTASSPRSRMASLKSCALSGTDSWCPTAVLGAPGRTRLVPGSSRCSSGCVRGGVRGRPSPWCSSCASGTPCGVLSHPFAPHPSGWGHGAVGPRPVAGLNHIVGCPSVGSPADTRGTPDT